MTLLAGLTTIGAATPAPFPDDNVPRNYARLCNPGNIRPIGDLASLTASQLEVSAQALAGVPALRVVTIIFPSDPQSKIQRWLLTDSDAKNPHWYVGSATIATTITAVVAATPQDMRTLEFERAISAYEYLNELLQDDAAAKTRCADAFAHAFMPILAGELSAAVTDPGVASLAFTAGVQRAFATLDPTKARFYGLTTETRTALGPTPTVEPVYRDRGLPGDVVQEIDIVRLGTHPYTYVELVQAGGHVAVEIAPICLEGDHRCAAAYVWP